MKKARARRVARIVTSHPAKVVTGKSAAVADGFDDEEVTRELPVFSMAELLKEESAA